MTDKAGKLAKKDAELEKLAGEKIGYVKATKDGICAYDRIGGKILAGPFTLPKTKPERVQEPKEEPEREEEKKPLSGKSRTDQNGKMYVYADLGGNDYEVSVKPEDGLSVTRKTETFFVVEGEPDTAFEWEVRN